MLCSFHWFLWWLREESTAKEKGVSKDFSKCDDKKRSTRLYQRRGNDLLTILSTGWGIRECTKHKVVDDETGAWHKRTHQHGSLVLWLPNNVRLHKIFSTFVLMFWVCVVKRGEWIMTTKSQLGGKNLLFLSFENNIELCEASKWTKSNISVF
jgi:hypothetical protein